MMGNGRADKASANDHNISGGWEWVSAAVAVKFVRLNAPKGIERGWCGRWCERHCCAVDRTTTCLLQHILPSEYHLDLQNIGFSSTCGPNAISKMAITAAPARCTTRELVVGRQITACLS